MYNPSSALAGAIDQAIDFLLRKQMAKWDSTHGGISRQGNHFVPMTSQEKSLNVFYRNTQLHSDEGFVSCRVKDSRHPQDPLLGKSASLQGQIGHDFHR